MQLCKCGCGQLVAKTWARGHHRRGRKLTDTHKANIGKSVAGTRNPNYKTGESFEPTKGRWYVNGPHGGSRLRSRVVMEQHLGRKLLRNEIIHHINSNKTDDRIENLQLCCSHADHRRVEYHPFSPEDLIAQLQALAQTLGRFPTEQECDKSPLTHNYKTYIKAFGSWAQVRTAASFGSPAISIAAEGDSQ